MIRSSAVGSASLILLILLQIHLSTVEADIVCDDGHGFNVTARVGYRYVQLVCRINSTRNIDCNGVTWSVQNINITLTEKTKDGIYGTMDATCKQLNETTISSTLEIYDVNDKHFTEYFIDLTEGTGNHQRKSIMVYRKGGSGAADLTPLYSLLHSVILAIILSLLH